MPPRRKMTATVRSSLHSFDNMEDVIRLVDKNGCWQYWTTVKASFLMIGMSLIRNAQGLLFLSKIDYNCAQETKPSHQNGQPTANSTEALVTQFSTNVKSRCFLADNERCTSWNYSSPYFNSTIMSEYELVCERSYLLPTFQATIFVGQVFGNPLSRIMSDRYGRRMTLHVSYLGLLVTSLTMFVTQSFWVNMLLRTLGGAFGAAAWNALFALCMELAVPERQRLVSVYSAVSWPIGAMLAALMGVYIRDWRRLCWISVAVTAASGVPLAFTLPESPRWLVLQRHDIGRAYKILRSRANSQRSTISNDVSQVLPEDDEFLRILYRRHTAEQLLRTHSGSPLCLGKLARLLCERHLYVHSHALSILSMAVAFTYFGTLIYGSDGLFQTSVHPLLLLGVMSFARAVSYPFYTTVFKFFGCRNTMRNSLFVMLILLLGIGFKPPSHTWLLKSTYAFVFVTAHVLSDLCFCTLTLYTGSNDLFPAELRAMSVGFFSLIGRIGSCASPFAAKLLPDVLPELPVFVFAGASAVAALAVLALPSSPSGPNGGEEEDVGHSEITYAESIAMQQHISDTSRQVNVAKHEEP